MEEEYQVRKLTPADLPGAIRWMADCCYGGDVEQGRKHFEDHFHGGTTFAAMRGKETVGFVTIRWVRRSLERATGERIPLINQMEAADPHKWRCLGNRLMAAAESRMAERST